MSVQDNRDGNPNSDPNTAARTRQRVPAGLKIFLFCIFGGLLFKGWLAFFVGMGVAPLETIAEVIGLAIAPFIVGWILAKALSLALKKVSFHTLWFIGSSLMIALMFIGQWRGTTGI